MKKILWVLLICISGSANAALVSVDWKSPGDNLVTRDTGTGLEWLDVTQTADLTFNFVSSELGGGGIYEGWSFATGAQVRDLYSSAGATGPYTGFNPGHFDAVTSLLSLVGEIETTATRSGSLLLVADIPATAPGNHYWLEYVIVSGSSGLFGETNSSNYRPDDSSNFNIASALIRTTPVPVPAAVWLFGSALGLLGWMQRKTA